MSTESNQPNTSTPTEGQQPQGIPLDQAVRQYLSNNPTKIMIGTPCYGGQCHVGYFQSMMDLSVNFTKLGIPFELIDSNCFSLKKNFLFSYCFQ